MDNPCERPVKGKQRRHEVLDLGNPDRPWVGKEALDEELGGRAKKGNEDGGDPVS